MYYLFNVFLFIRKISMLLNFWKKFPRKVNIIPEFLRDSYIYIFNLNHLII